MTRESVRKVRRSTIAVAVAFLILASALVGAASADEGEQDAGESGQPEGDFPESSGSLGGEGGFKHASDENQPEWASIDSVDRSMLQEIDPPGLDSHFELPDVAAKNKAGKVNQRASPQGSGLSVMGTGLDEAEELPEAVVIGIDKPGIDLNGRTQSQAGANQELTLVPEIPAASQAVAQMSSAGSDFVVQRPTLGQPSSVTPLGPIPDIPFLSYAICHYITTPADTVCEFALIGVPIPVDLNGNNIPDTLVTVVPCGVICVTLSIEAVPNVLPSLTYSGPAVLYLVYDMTPKSSEQSLIVGGYDTIFSGADLPQSLHATIEFDLFPTNESWLEISLEVDGINLPLRFFSIQENINSNGVLARSETFVVEYHDVIPSASNIRIEKSEGDNVTTLGYIADNVAEEIYFAHIIEDFRRGHNIEFMEIEATQGPIVWDLVISSKNGTALDYSASSVIDQMDYLKARLIDGWSGSLVEIEVATVQNVATSATLTVTDCIIGLSANSAMNIEYQRGKEFLLTVPDPYHGWMIEADIGGTKFNNSAVRVDGILSAQMDFDCDDVSSVTWSLSDPLPTFSVLSIEDTATGQTIIEVDVSPAFGHGMPAEGTIMLVDGEAVHLMDTSDPFGELSFCITTTATCFVFAADEDFVFIYDDGTDDSITGLLTGLKGASLEYLETEFSAAAEFQPGGQVFEILGVLNGDQVYGRLSETPSAFSIFSDLESMASFETDSAISLLEFVALSDGTVILTELEGIPGDTEMFVGYEQSGPQEFQGQFVSSNYVSQLVGCYSAAGTCPLIVPNGLLVDIDLGIYTFNIQDIKAISGELGVNFVEGNIESVGGFDFIGILFDNQVNNPQPILQFIIEEIPSDLSIVYNAQTDRNKLIWDGNNERTARIEFWSEGFFVEAIDVPESVVAIWDVSGSPGEVSLDMSSSMGTLFGCATALSGPWRSASVQADGLNSFEMEWRESPFRLDIDVLNNNEIDLIRAYVSDTQVCGVPAITSNDYVVMEQPLGYAAAQITGLRGLFSQFNNNVGSVDLQMERGRTLFLLWDDGVNSAIGEIQNIPAHTKLDFNWAGNRKTVNYNGHGQTSGSVHFEGFGFLATASNLPSRFDVDVNFVSRNAEVVITGVINSLFVHGTMSGRSLNVLAEGVRSFDVDWNSDLSFFDFNVRGSQQINMVRFYMADASGVIGVPAISTEDYLSHSSTQGVTAVQITGLRNAAALATPTHIRGNLEMQPGRNVWVSWVTPDRILSGELFGIPARANLHLDLLNEELKLELTTPSTTVPSAWFYFEQPTAPRAVFLEGTGIPGFDIDFDSSFQYIDVDAHTRTGTLALGINVNGAAFGTPPADFGVHYIDDGTFHYVAARLDSLDRGKIDMRGNELDALIATGGGMTAEAFLWKGPNNWVYGEITLPNGAVTLVSDIRSHATFTTPTSISEVLVLSQWGNRHFEIVAQTAPSFTVDVKTGPLRVDITPSGTIGQLGVDAQDTSIGGVLGTGYRFINGVVTSVPNAPIHLKFDHVNNVYDANLGAPVGAIEVHVSRFGTAWTAANDHFVWDRTGNEESFNFRMEGLQRAMFNEGQGRAVLETIGGRAFLAVLLDGSDQTNLEISSLPTSVDANWDFSRIGSFAWDASSRPGKIVLATNTMGCSGDIQYLETSSIPAWIDVDWNLNNPGHINVDLSSRLSVLAQFEWCGHIIGMSASVLKAEATWDVGQIGQTTFNTDNFLFDGHVFWLLGSDWGVWIEGGIWANNFVLNWFWSGGVPIPWWSGSINGNVDIFVRIFGTWWHLF